MSVDLLVAPCSYKAAKYAVMNWHYSKRMPKSRQEYYGAWEDTEFIGAVIFGKSVTPHLGKKYNLTSWTCAELTRVALSTHLSPVSQIVTCAIKQTKTHNPGLRLLISYADPNVGHEGTIYQAMNWVYVGRSASIVQYYFRGAWRNDTRLFKMFADSPHLRDGIETRSLDGKLEYLYPLDKAMRRQIEPLAQPYPKRADVGEIESRFSTTE